MNTDEEKDGNNDSSDRNIIKEMDEESIEITESAPSSQNIYCLEYEHVQMKHEGANLELHVNEDKTYIEDNVERHVSPERKEENKNLALDKLNTSLEHTQTNLDWKETEQTQVETNS